MRRIVFYLCLVLYLLIACEPVFQDTKVHITDTNKVDNHTQIESIIHEESLVIVEKAEGNTIDQYAQVLELLAQYDTGKTVDAAFLSWACKNITSDFAAKLSDYLETNGWGSEPFYELFGETLHVLWDRYTEKAENASNIHRIETGDAVTLAFAGDVNLADNWENMQAYRTQPDGVDGVLSAPLLKRMRNADILLVNNEFCFSERGTPAAGKQYTFRAATENVKLYYDLGVDIVSLANNHVFDYGTQAFHDTLNTLSEAGIPYVGAGQDISGAMQAQYFHAGGMKIAYIAAAQTDIFRFTPSATTDNNGVLPCFDGGGLLEAVTAARECSDWVIVYLHWGTEYATMSEEQQTSLARNLVDNGVDVVVGAHPHVLQGIEFYKDKPIVYSLGNFWFNIGWVNSALLEIELLKPGQYRLYMQPCATAQGTVRLMEEDTERHALFRHLESISEGILINDDGTVIPNT